MLVWCEHYGGVGEAIAREKQLKKWERRWKLDLIERFNPSWTDLYETLYAWPNQRGATIWMPAFAGMTTIEQDTGRTPKISQFTWWIK